MRRTCKNLRQAAIWSTEVQPFLNWLTYIRVYATALSCQKASPRAGAELAESTCTPCEIGAISSMSSPGARLDRRCAWIRPWISCS